MKKVFFLLLTAALSVQGASAQKALVESKTFDNWYVGVQGGASTKLTHSAVIRNLNPFGGLRLGRNFTPVLGLAVEGSAYVRDRQFNAGRAHNTFIRAVDAHLLGTLNLSNWFGGYTGKPRCAEFVLVGGPGWNHVYGYNEGAPNNDLTLKSGLDINFNLGKKRAWQLYVEPAILYNLDRYERTTVKAAYSALQLAVGLNYKFGNSNGTHNFVKGDLRDQYEIDELNARISELRKTNDEQDRQLKEDARAIAQLRADLEAAQNVKPTVVQNVVKQVVNNNVLQPTIIFGQGKATVDAAQMASVAMVAKYMKSHPEARLLIKGYASPEGNPELNQRLSEKRAQSVKDVLVNRYSVRADRLEVKGMGATDELFDEVDFNRVATFTDLTK